MTHRRVYIIFSCLISLFFALLVCLDPFLAKPLHIDFLNRVPYTLSLIISLLLLGGFVLIMKVESIWMRKELVFIGMTFLAAQLIGLNLGPIDPLDMATIIIFLLWTAIIFNNREYKVVVTPVALMILGLLFLAFLSSINEWLTLFIVALFALTMKFIVYFNLTQSIRKKEVIQAAVKIFIGVAIFSSVVAIVQVALYLLTGLELTFVDKEEILFKPTPFGMILRATAFSPKAAHLSGYLLLSLPMMLFWASFPDTSRRTRLLLGFGAFLTSVAIILTITVGAWVTLGLILLLFPYFRWTSRSVHITLAVVSLLLILYSSGLVEWGYGHLKTSGTLKGGGQRVYLITLAIEKLERDPIVGEGLRNFGRFTKNYRQYPVHNAYFQAAVELGIMGGIIFCSIIGWLFVRLLLSIFTIRAVKEKLMLKMFLLGLIGMIVAGMSEPTFDHPNTWIYFGFVEAGILTYMKGYSAASEPINYKK